MFSTLKQKLKTLIGSQIEPLRDEMFFQTDSLRFSLGQLLTRNQVPGEIKDLRQAEFKVFSQWGEDGIIQFLTKVVPIAQRSFVEIGVENYWESNTRFLLMHDHWAGVIIDASDTHARFLQQSGLRWRYNIEAMTAFVTRENIDELLTSGGIPEDLGLLSLDIDGMDYWVLEAIKAASARILIVEYNSRFGCTRPVTVPYKAVFNRTAAHYSNCYYGASLAAFYEYARKHGYAFVGANTAGTNAFFVRRDVLPPALRALTLEEGFVASQTRESRAPDGSLTCLSTTAERELIKDLPVVDILDHSTVRLRDVFET